MQHGLPKIATRSWASSCALQNKKFYSFHNVTYIRRKRTELWRKRKPTHPGEILEEHYIKPLKLHLGKLAAHLEISRKTLHKIRTGEASITVSIALALAQTFDTTPEFWLNLQQKHDLWVEEKHYEKISPIIKNGALLPSERHIAISAKSY